MIMASIKERKQNQERKKKNDTNHEKKAILFVKTDILGGRNKKIEKPLQP